MKLIFATCLFAGAIAACDRVCGDLQPLATGGAGASAGEGGASAGEGGASAGEGGASAGEGGDMGGAGGVTNGGGRAGSEASGAGGVVCQMLTDPHIIDFDESGTSAPALGTMVSEAEGPEGRIESYMGSKVYRETGEVKSNQVTGFSFQFSPCIADAPGYVGINFDVRANQSSLGLDVSMTTASGTGASVGVAITDFWQTKCVPFAVIGDPKAMERLIFRYPISASSRAVDLYVDNLAFSSGGCSPN